MSNTVRNRTVRAVVAAPVLALALAGCGGGSSDADGAGSPETSSSTSSSAAGAGQGQEMFPDVLDAEITSSGDTYSVAATLSSPYDSPERYADAIRVRTAEGEVLGVRELTHDHASEQPFTRNVTGVELPDGVSEVVVEGRDMVSGWGGATTTVQVPAES